MSSGQPDDPCRAVSPTIEALGAEYSGDARIGKLNIDENPVTAAAFGITSIPAVLVFSAEKVVQNIVGVQTLEQYKRDVDKVLTSAA